MADQNDHDILVSLKTLMDVMIANQAEFNKRFEEKYSKLDNRVAILENSDSRDSEKFRTITDEIKRSLNNSSRIDTLDATVRNLGENMKDLKSKSNLFDIGNAIAVAIAGAIGFFHR